MALTKEDQERIRNRWQNRNSGSSTTTSEGTSTVASLLSDEEKKRVSESWNKRFDVDDTYINTFISDANSFLNKVQAEYEKLDSQPAASESSQAYYDSMRKTEDDLSNRAWRIKNFLNTRKGDIDENTYNSMSAFLDNFSSPKYAQVFHPTTRYAKTYTGKTTSELDEIITGLEDGEEKDWLTSYRGAVDYDEKSKYDLEAGAKEIADLERAADVMASVSNEYFALQNNPSQFTDAQRIRITSQYNALVGRYGSPEKLHDTLNKKKQYHTLAGRVQEGIKLAGVADSSSELYDPEFTQYANYVTDGKTPLIPDYKDVVYNVVNNNVDSYKIATGQAWGRFSDTEIGRLDAVKYMTADEKALYNYYYNKQGYKAAEEYLDNLMDKLNAQKGAEIFKALENKPALELVFSAAAGLDQFNSGVKNLFSTKDYIPTSATQYASGMVREDLKDVDLKYYNIKEGQWGDAKIFGNSLGQSVYDLGTTTANMAPSILVSSLVGTLNPVAGAVVGNTLMGASAAGNAYQEVLNQGYGKAEARAYSTAVGVSEALLQYALGGIGNLGGVSSKLATAVEGIDKALLRFSLQYGGKFASEALEEGLQEVLDPVFKNAILHTDEDVNWSEVAYSALLGGLSAGVFEGIPTAVNVAKEQALKKEYDGKTDTLINQGLQNDVNSKSYQLAQQYKVKTDAGKNLTGAQIRNLLAANQDAITANDMKKIQQAAEKRLADLGQTKDVSKVAELAAKYATGQKLTRAETSLLSHSEYGNKVAHDLLQDSVVQEINAENYGSKAIRSVLDKMASATYTSLDDRVGDKRSFKVSEDKQATDSKTGDKVDLQDAEVVRVGKDGMTIKVDGKEVKASDIEYASGDQSYLYEAVSKIENITPEAATAIINGYDPSSEQSVSAYLNGIDEAYQHGYYGYDKGKMGQSKFASKLTKEQSDKIYEIGRNASKSSTESADDAKKNAGAKQTEQEKEAKLKSGIEGNNTEVYYRDGKNAVKFDKSGKKYDAKRMAAVNTAKFLSKLGIGGKFYFYESYMKDGVRVYKDLDGKEVAAPNGIYMEKDGSIHIDLNAGDRGQGTALFTLGHELTHFIKDHSKQQFKTLSDLVAEAFDKTDLSMHKRVLAKQKFLENKYGEPVSYSLAHEEVMADSLSTMLSDGRFYDLVMEIKVKDKGLFRTIKLFFKHLVEKFTSEYAKLTPDQRDAQDIRQMKDMFDKIQKVFAEALVEASDNFQATQAQKNTTEDGGAKMQTRTVNGEQVVWIENSGFTNKQLHDYSAIAEFIAEHIGDYYTIIESGQNVYIGEDLPNEYTHSKYTSFLQKKKPALLKAKNRASSALGGMIEIATNRRWEPTDHKATKDAKYGMYRYDTKFAFPIKDQNGNVTNVKAYDAELLIRNASDGKKYLYDVVNIKEDTTNALDLKNKEARKGSYKATTQGDVINDNVAQNTEYVNTESTEAMDVEMDAKTESVAPAVMKSERTWTESDYVQERNKAAKEIAKAIGVTEKKAKDYIDSVNSISKMIAEDRSRLDYFSSPGRSSFIGNVEYGGSFDFSTLCKKRRLLTGTFTAIQKALPNTALTANEILDIRNRMKDAGLEVSCGLCYVEGSRANMGQFAKEFLRLYKQYYPDAWQPNMADVNTPDGIEWVRINHPECYEQYEYFWNHYGTLKAGDKNLFASQQKPKLYQLHTEYKGEILQKFKDDNNVEEKNINGGIRLQSFSDFEIVHLIDTMQIIMDMSRVGLAGQAYTKVPDFAWALGDTGLKINLSLIAKGVDENGKLIFDDVEGMPIAEAMKLRDRYSKNVGTILVAFNDEQLLAAMADDRVDFIIPFHRSQWKKSQYEAMGLPAKTKDYTYMQNEKFIKPQFHEYRGRMVRDKATNYMPNEYWDFSKSGKENAEAYLEMCARNNKRPKFYKLLQNNGDGSYSLKADGSTDGYWKLLIDFKMYDNDGNGSPQMAVKPEFNMDEANRMLETYKGGHSNFPVAQGVVDGFVKEYKASHKGEKFSDRDSSYLDAVNRGDMETAQKMVDKAAKKAGYTVKAYHGTPIKGITVFDNAKIGSTTDDGIFGHGFYFTTNKMTADGYATVDGETMPVFLRIEKPWWGLGHKINDVAVELGISQEILTTRKVGKNSSVVAPFTKYARVFTSHLTENGYDSVVVQHGFHDYEIVVFDNTKIKSADPVTYDGDGNVIPLSRRFNKENDDIRYSERGEDTSNRALLVNAFEGLSRSSVEYAELQEYKKQIKVLNMLDEQLSDLNAEIHEIRFTKGKYDAEKLRKLEEKAERIAKDINKQDKVLTNMEASEPLRKIIAFERKKAAQKTKEHIAEIQKRKAEKAEQTELRHKIRKTVRDLDKLLNRGNKKRNVKEDMQGFVSKALELADYLFTDHISDDDLIRRGIDSDLVTASGKAQLVKETEDILTKLYDEADSLTDEEFTRLDAKRKENEAKLRDLLTAQRNEMLSTPVYKLFNDLVTEYASLKNSSQEAVKGAYDPKVEEFLRSYLGETIDGTDSDRKKLLQNMRLADMTTEELWKLHNAYTMVLHSVRTANKLFVNGKTESLEQMANRIVADFSQRKAPDGKAKTVIRNLSNKLGWDYEKLYYALDRIGSEAFTELVMNLANSENIVMEDVKEAKAFLRDIVKKYDFNNWDYSKEIDRDFLDTTGKKFRMTLGQLMSLYAYSRRDGAWDHIEYGGFVFGETALTNPKPADSYKLSKDQCEAITNTLTKEQKAYVEDMQKFLSETMGAKGNEVSMLLYGIKMFGEKNYFPIHIAGQFKAQANESQAKAAAGFGTMTNAGFTHAQNPNAKAPFVLEGFNEIWADHVNEMSRYHGAVPALEDMRRVMNRSSYSEAEADSVAIKQLMENSFGKDAVDYFDNLYREANSGAITDKMQRLPKKLLSLFRKTSVAYKASVWIQQPSAMVRAYAMIDQKYFGFKGVGALTSGVVKTATDRWTKAQTKAYNEMLKYAPGVTMAKEIGGFDTHTGSSIREYLLDTEKSFKQSMKTENLKGNGKAVLDLVDDNAIANLPNVADKIAWIEIWNACKRETVAKHKDLATNSEEFMQIVGKRFTEIIRATQVYDSIFAKSPMLKSKNLAVQYLVSFMNEPNTTANMMEKAVRDIAKGELGSGAKIVGAVAYSIIFNNVLKSIVYAMRDDDEDETYIEKYMSALVGGLIDDTLPINYIPFVRDVWSKLRGFDVERPDMAIITDVIDAYQAIAKLNGKDTENMTEEQLIEYDKKLTEATWGMIGTVAAVFGIPVKNIYREIDSIIDQAKIASANAGLTTPDSLWDKVKEEIVNTIPIGKKETKTDKLYNAIISGDTKYIERIKDTYKTNDSYQSAVRKALRENDPRIHEAAQARIDGNTEEYKRIFREIKDERKFSFDDIMSAINSEESKIRKGTEPEKATSDYTAGGYVEAIAMGNTTEAMAMKDDIIAAKVANGKTQEEAEKEFKTSVATSIGEAYSSGLLDDAQAKEMLMEYAGKDEEEAASKVSYWSFLDAHPEYEQYKLSESNVGDYLEFAEPAEIPMEVYVQYRDGTKGIAEIKDEWGDVEVTKREQVLEVIDSLPLTWQQKDALYLAAGYSESKIWDVPW